MHKVASLICVFLLSSIITNAQTGRVYDNLTLNSKILKGERNFSIYLPPDYESSMREYPVLYLLHGAGDDHTGWVQFGEILHITDKAIKEGKATPMIIVMPDANTGQRGYFNRDDWRYEDFFFEELMPYVEKAYRIKSEKRYRAVSGLSMGGGGAFMYALHKPELFSSACPLSASVGMLPQDTVRINDFARDKEKSIQEIRTYLNHHSAISLLDSVPIDKIKSVRWYIDCGDDDFLFEGNSLVHIAMKKKRIEHEYRVRDGGHTWTYWRESLPNVLQFISDAFHQY